jgi:hypothetical protein
MTGVEEAESGVDLPEYYRQLNEKSILSAFKDFDNRSNFKSLDDKVRHTRTRNFVVDFGDDEAFCGFDLEADAVKKLLKAPVSIPHLKLQSQGKEPRLIS